MKATTVEKVFNLMDKTLFKVICKSEEEKKAMKLYLIATLAVL